MAIENVGHERRGDARVSFFTVAKNGSKLMQILSEIRVTNFER
jgi:hypothetical protein